LGDGGEGGEGWGGEGQEEGGGKGARGWSVQGAWLREVILFKLRYIDRFQNKSGGEEKCSSGTTVDKKGSASGVIERGESQGRIAKHN